MERPAKKPALVLFLGSIFFLFGFTASYASLSTWTQTSQSDFQGELAHHEEREEGKEGEEGPPPEEEPAPFYEELAESILRPQLLPVPIFLLILILFLWRRRRQG